MTEPITPTNPTNGEAPVAPVTPPAEPPKTPEAPKAPETPAPSQEAPKSLMDEATAEEKQAKEAEDKRLLEADPATLNDADKQKREELVKAKAEADKANVVPEKYEFKVPEGMTLDQALVDKITPIFKEAKINQATAQKLADAYAETIKSQGEAYTKQQEANFNAFVENLKTETMNELGKDGQNAREQLAFAARARDRFMPKELIEKLNISGLANDVHMVKFLISIGKQVSEGTIVQGSRGAGEANPLDTLYPSMAKK